MESQGLIEIKDLSETEIIQLQTDNDMKINNLKNKEKEKLKQLAVLDSKGKSKENFNGLF